MSDQVNALRSSNIEAGTINSTTSYEERQRLLRDLETGHPLTRLLYVTPEQCSTETFRKHLSLVHRQRELARIAVDEAHCISEWGHDFRPSFREIKWLRIKFPDVPIMCLTATAIDQVRADVINLLGLNPSNLRIFTMTTARKNLHYEVRFKNDEEDHYYDFLGWIKMVHRRRAENTERRAELERRGERLDNVSGIIYTIFRQDCESLASRLCASGIGAKPYHAGLRNDDKKETLESWVNNIEGYDVIVATTAFGMGINKEDVRFVVHWQLPKSFEGYYQEAGRAGRDGKASLCIMYYSREDRDRAFHRMNRDGKENESHVIAKNKSLQALVNYCENTDTCRHYMITKYFGETEIPECDYACDWHKDAEALLLAKTNGLQSEAWVGTQNILGRYRNSSPLYG